MRMRPGTIVVALALGIGACGRGGSPARDQGLPDSSATTRTPSGSEFVETGPIAAGGEEHGDATQVSSLIAAPAGGGERFIVAFARADGFPATTLGKVTIELRRDERVIRIHLPSEVVSTAITDNTFTGEFTERAFVVRALGESGLFVDLHLRSAALARADVYSHPALVIVDLKQGGSILPPPPLIGDHVVVLTPPRAGRVSYPFDVTGYARTFEANVVAELQVEERAAARQSTTAADYASAWGEYRMRFESGPRGRVELFVGEYSAKDGQPVGVRTDLQVN